MRALVIAFLISSFCCAFVHSIELKCDVLNNGHWKVIGSQYECQIENQEIITDKFNRVVHSVTANHEDSKSNDDVKGIYIYDSTVNFFPRGVEKYFKNLEGIAIQNSSLKEIHKSDLKPFTKLRILYLIQNQLEVIEANLFDNNPKLEGIFLWENRISHVDAKVFDKFVGKLRWLYLSDNICQLGNSHDNIQDSNKIIAQIQVDKCKDEDKLAAFYLNSVDGEDQFKAMSQIVENSMKKLENTLVSKIEQIARKLQEGKLANENEMIEFKNTLEAIKSDQNKENLKLRTQLTVLTINLDRITAQNECA